METKEILKLHSGLTPRAVIWGLVIGVIMQATIYYMTMALGFSIEVSGISALFGMLVLPIIGGKANRYEINIVHTIASATAAMAFPLAAYYIVILQRGETVNTAMLIVLLLLAGIVGVALNTILRKHYVNDPTLPFPIATYVAEVVKKTDERDKYQIRCLWIGIVIGVVFTLLQDGTHIIPSSVLLTKGLSIGITLTIGFMPLAMALGYLMGKPAGLYMLGGALLSGLVIAPIATAFGWIPNPNIVEEGASALASFNLPLFLGVTVIGTFAFLLRNVKKLNFKSRQVAGNGAMDRELPMKPMLILGGVALVGILLLMTFVFHANLLAVLASMAVGIGISYIYTRIQAQTGMGVQSYLTLITFVVALLLIKNPLIALVTITIIGVIGGLSGDTISDFKTGQILGASPKEQFISQFIGFAPAVILGVVLVSIMVSRFGIGTAEAPYPAAQIFYAASQTATGAISEVLSVPRLVIGSVVGAVMGFLGLPAPILGMSIYLGMGIMTSGGIGCLIRMFVTKKWGAKGEALGLNTAAGISIGAGIIITIFTYATMFM